MSDYGLCQFYMKIRNWIRKGMGKARGAQFFLFKIAFCKWEYPGFKIPPREKQQGEAILWSRESGNSMYTLAPYSILNWPCPLQKIGSNVTLIYIYLLLLHWFPSNTEVYSRVYSIIRIAQMHQCYTTFSLRNRKTIRILVCLRELNELGTFNIDKPTF